MDFNKKRNREFFNEKLLFQAMGILFLIAIFLLLLADYKIYQKKKELTVEINNYKNQIEEIEKSSQNLKEEIANANNTDYLEKIAYEQLGEQKPGEKQVIFITPPKKAESTQLQENYWSAKFLGSWFNGVWQWIKSKF